MKVLIFDELQSITEREFQNDLLNVPQWRRDKALSFKFFIDKVLCIKSYLLLKKGLELEFGIIGNPEFSYLENGKPILKYHPDIHFNLSHCKKGIICVLDEKPVGCDIEEIPDEIDMQLCEFSFNKQELNQIKGAENSCIEFAKLWTKKEALLKLSGEGLTDDLKTVLSKNQILNKSFKTTVCLDKGYVYTFFFK